MSVQACVICSEPTVEIMATGTGERAYCLSCFHGWRISNSEDFGYSDLAMCSLGTSQERLDGQIGFFRQFAPANARILEIGCATGELAVATIGALKPARYEAIELSPAGAEAAKHIDKLHTKPLPMLIEDGTIEPGFDLILMSHVLEHIDDPAAELRAMKSVLTPGGAMFIEVPNGAGHRHLPIDDNRSHYHYFSATSLARILALQGLEVIAGATDAWLDARYADSLRVMARPFALPKLDTSLLSSSPLLGDEPQIVVWGAGRLADEVLANFFDPNKIEFFIDKNPAKHGTTLLGRPVKGPDALGHSPRTVLLNSVDFAPAIAADIRKMYPETAHRLVAMTDLFNGLK